MENFVSLSIHLKNPFSWEKKRYSLEKAFFREEKEKFFNGKKDFCFGNSQRAKIKKNNQFKYFPKFTELKMVLLFNLGFSISYFVRKFEFQKVLPPQLEFVLGGKTYFNSHFLTTTVKPRKWQPRKWWTSLNDDFF